MKKAKFKTNDSEIEYVNQTALEKTLLLLLCDKNSKLERDVSENATTLRFSKENGKFVEFTITEEE